MLQENEELYFRVFFDFIALQCGGICRLNVNSEGMRGSRGGDNSFRFSTESMIYNFCKMMSGNVLDILYTNVSRRGSLSCIEGRFVCRLNVNSEDTW